MSFLNSLENRRSIYALGKEIDADKAIKTIKEAVKQSPSAFNSQTSRVLILAGEDHDKLWKEIVAKDLKAEMDRQGVPESVWEGTKSKLDGFAAAGLTALFFEDTAVVKGLQEQFPLYADNFPVWSEQSTGIASVNAWVALSDIGLGANLQHYNPVIDESVAKTYDIPASWALRGQLVVGSPQATPDPKAFMDDDERFKVFGA
ncbi:MAG: nitroreductase family protein [Lactococcus plantarum]|nr:nitroreductase family protein [Lactococcus plantarum]MDN6085200.1 nitroreductase family protein [Lactococcus plantarum]